MNFAMVETNHLLTLLESIELINDMVEELPQTDAVVTMRDIIETHAYILCEVAKGRHYGDSALEEFTNHIKGVRANLQMIART